MLDKDGAGRLLDYTVWANHRVMRAAATLSVDDFKRDLRANFGGVRGTLCHILAAEWIWLERWKGVSPEAMFHAADFPNFDAVRARWSAIERAQRSFVDAVTDEQLPAVVRYVNLKGEAWQYPLWRQMAHVVNHSTYHRGQLTTMLRQLGARTVSTDLLMFDDDQTSSRAEARRGEPGR
jgi:uncharacterized damage-inducible protein DinB